MPADLDDCLGLAAALADAAGAAIRPHFRTRLAVDDKPDLTPVTVADRAAEAAMRELLEARFPEHGIIGEEYGRVREDAEFVWVLDPIDGTKSFISGVPLFGTLIALARAGRPILGIIDQPISRERWVGAEGRPTTLNGAPVRCRPCAGLETATLFATTPDMFEGADAARFARVKGAAKLTRYGGDCYAYGLLAAGFIDLVLEANLKPYDFCAMIPIVEGAGGVTGDWQGNPLSLASDGRVLVAGDRRIFAAALALLDG
ncbi:MAG TPA: histidinol-phosphatase [Stellaceae bacterium]|jgi:inositol-phosphate phosphatase/L-galactose 1-phosphate phosphatase/histidinol-phosphatase|nr:histidinol-phosphatase [Stellaceae bacterium]